MSASTAHRAAEAAYDAVTRRGASRAEASRAFYIAREAACGHRDAVERATLVAAVQVAGFRRGIPQAELDAACGLPQCALTDSSALTAGLRAALARMRGGAT